MISRRRCAHAIALAVVVGACQILPDDRGVADTSSVAGDTQTIELSEIPPATPRIDDTLVALDNGDSTVSTANGTVVREEEAFQLAATLTIPVAGVKVEDLLDTFNEARGDRTHEALDIPAPRGTPVLSATSGRVLRLYTSQRGGLMIYAADSSERFILLYAHLDRYAPGLTDSTALQAGQVIGYVGTTGNAPPNVPHLHFAIARSTNVKRWWEGTAVDPLPLLQRSSRVSR